MTTALQGEVTGAPVIIADGLRGNSDVDVPVDGQHVAVAHIGADIHHSDGLVVMTHFKGHELTGYGGAIKNVGMGCASRRGKLDQHSNISPKISGKKCIGCGNVFPGVEVTLFRSWEKKDRKAQINPELCVGCAECILTCRQGAISIQWNESIPTFMEKMVEYQGCAKPEEAENCFHILSYRRFSSLRLHSFLRSLNCAGLRNLGVT